MAQILNFSNHYSRYSECSLFFFISLLYQVVGPLNEGGVGPKGDPGLPGTPGIKGDRGPPGK